MLCHAIEVNPAYVDVAVRRWQAFTGQSACLQGGGGSFADVAAQRGVALQGTTDGTARP